MATDLHQCRLLPVLPTRAGAVVLAAVLVLIGCIVAGHAREKTSAFALSVPAGGWTAADFHGLPAGGRLDVALSADGAVEVLLYHREEVEDYPTNADALYRGETEDTLRFVFRLPRTGAYLLVLDNRAGAAARQVAVEVTASTDGSTEAPRPRTAPGVGHV